MPEVDGFDVLQAIGVGRVPAVIFVTAPTQGNLSLACVRPNHRAGKSGELAAKWPFSSHSTLSLLSVV